MTVCVLSDLTWLPLIGVGRKSWYIIIINYCCYTKCQHTCLRLYAIVTDTRAVQSLVVIGIHWQSVTILIYNINSCCHFCHSLKLICAFLCISFFLSNFLVLALKIIANTSLSLEFGQRFNSDMILEAAIGVCIHEWSKIQYVNKAVVKRSLIGSSTWIIGPLADFSGFHCSYEMGRRPRKYWLISTK